MHKQVFFDQLEKFETGYIKQAKQADELIQKQKKQLHHDMFELLSQPKKLNSRGALAKQFDSLNFELKNLFEEWDKQIFNLLKMQQLANTYQNRIIFLVFGKVNAGKSSFTNFISELFESNQVKRFTLQDGKIVQVTEKFKEGCTETTSTIQGVELGQHFLLLDSPGLHSVTEENGALTKEFVDCTDAILWLTPSSSPGQTQELDELREELSKSKPLLPIITASDILEEDEDDDGELIQFYINKSDHARQAQEEDVQARLNQYAQARNQSILSVLKKPISISVYMYRENQDAEAAGLNRLLLEMSSLLKEACEYKLRKSEQQAQNFLKEKMLSMLEKNFLARLKEVEVSIDTTLDTLDKQAKTITLDIQSEMLILVPKLIEKHAKQKDKNKLVEDINQKLNTLLNQKLSETLGKLVSEIQKISDQISSDQIKDFENNTIEIEQSKGKVLSTATSILGGLAGGAATGAAVGTLGAGPIGTAAGAIVGGIVGGVSSAFAGEKLFVETETVTEIVGVSSLHVEESLQTYFDQQIPKFVDKAFEQVKNELKNYDAQNSALKQIVNAFKHKIENNQLEIKNVA